MMAFDWDTLFGTAYCFNILNTERPYLGLDLISEDWEITRFTGKIHTRYTRTTLYWSGNEIKKVIHEENVLSPDADEPTSRSMKEYDTCLKTEGREMLLPLTAKGKPKKVTASNVLAVMPFGSSFRFCVGGSPAEVSMCIYNTRNHRDIIVGERERLSAVRSDADFHRFMDYYMQSCPKDYFERIERLRTAKPQTVKYRTGDIFRIELDRFRYTYGLITGQVKNILKWPEFPQYHSLRGLMMVPILVRYYDLVTERADLTAEELAAYPLGRTWVCGDNDIIWGTHSIIGHRELTEDDIEFNLVCTKIRNPDPRTTVNTCDLLKDLDIPPSPDDYSLCVEWGTSRVFLPPAQLSEHLRDFLKSYRNPHGGVLPGIFPDLDGSHYMSRLNLLNPENTEMRRELFRCLGLDPDSDFDAFAVKFGGLTKEEILKRPL